ncbi:guanine deaminase [Salpingoeca rosetta]|uniref:Guanine deaminase n=1 Tax=Salpingoeca rosetta (strain ATCC 50818 / BSB-021) TaxID=946362 RepID=F2UC70_SALR5|nr:guanine deaminase [Salpingoeca rosetta]EGD74177.1 guanine deaminase [Salpingoeca rosetta]|eukprot:XP_004993077.1 guanine deaminase [Salpingoeca rosetta]
MPRHAYRASLLDFHQDATKVGLDGDGAKVASHIRFVDDGLLIVEDGKIAYAGAFEEELINGDTVHDFRGKIICPGFIDTHIHYPQMEMICAYGEQLLDWLKTYTFPTERKYSDKTYAREMAMICIRELFKNGTTTAAVFCTVHPESVDAFFEVAETHNMLVIAGKVLMDRNAPEYLQDTPERAYDESKALIEKWHGRGRCLYAITPRFAPTSTAAQLEAAGRLRREFPDVFVHTHLAENKAEVEWVQELFPEARSYFDVYKRFGLTGRRCIFAHCIHLDDTDMHEFSDSRSVAAFCPTSNLFLGSGLLPLQRMREMHVLLTLGTDVGAGTSFSMFQTFHDAYKVSQLQGAKLSVEEGLYMATLGAAHALGLDDRIGNLDVGKDADFVMLDPTATELQQLRWATPSPLSDRLFTLFMLGDHHNIFRTYVHGAEVYARSS